MSGTRAWACDALLLALESLVDVDREPLATRQTGLVLRWQRQTVKALGAQLPGLDDTESSRLLAHIKSSLNTSRLKAAVEQAHSWEGIRSILAVLDADPWLLNCTNGTLDLRTGELRPHRQPDLLTKCLPIAYDPEARCPQWIAFLENTMEGEATLIVFLQRALGYSLTGSTREQCFFLLHGPTKTGKSTFITLPRRCSAPMPPRRKRVPFCTKTGRSAQRPGRPGRDAAGVCHRDR